MSDYNVTFELDRSLDEDTLDRVVEDLSEAGLHPAAHGTTDQTALTVTVDNAGAALDAIAAASNTVLRLLPEVVLRTVEALPTAEYDRRAGLDDDGWMTVPQAAEALGISEQRVRQLLTEPGKLSGRKAGRDWNVSAQSVRDRIAALA